MKHLTRVASGATGLGIALFAALPAWAQDAAALQSPASAAPAATVNKGDTAWMMTATVLVMMMILPGLALFYGWCPAIAWPSGRTCRGAHPTSSPVWARPS